MRRAGVTCSRMLASTSPIAHDIEVLVRNFYRDAAMDDLLGPVFEAAG